MLKTRRAALAIVMAMAATPTIAAEPAYLDDRSTAAAVIRSYYNAINRHEYARAYSYYGQNGAPGDYQDFADGYQHTAAVALALGHATSEGAAGSIYYSVPVAIDATSDTGRHSQYDGCYTVRQVEPSIQEPPFQPIFIVSGKLTAAHGSLRALVPTGCGS